ncbi:MAG: glycosyltransferase family 4 protein [Candidatus Methanoperedens sp.]
MNILIISMSFPYPPKSGGKARVYNLIKQISKYHEITLISFISSDEKPYIPELLKYCKIVETIPFENNFFSKLVRWGRIVYNLFTTTPIEIAAKESQMMADKVYEIIKNHDFDIIQAEWIQMAHYVPFEYLNKKQFRGKLVLVEHDVSFVPWYRRYLIEKKPMKFIIYNEYKKMKKYEYENLLKFDEIITMSEIDMNRLLELDETLHVNVVPNGVDTEKISFKLGNRGSNSLLFMGWMKHYPNGDAMRFFIKEIFPKILLKNQNVKLYIVGMFLPDDINKKIKYQDNIIYCGYIEDILSILHKCTVFISPLRIGGGTRLKILEAMAAGIPVISTSIGAEGIDIEDGENIVIADSTEIFANKTLELLNDNKLQVKIAVNAHEFVEKKYRWNEIGKIMNRIYEKEYIGIRNENSNHN